MSRRFVPSLPAKVALPISWASLAHWISLPVPSRSQLWDWYASPPSLWLHSHLLKGENKGGSISPGVEALAVPCGQGSWCVSSTIVERVILPTAFTQLSLQDGEAASSRIFSHKTWTGLPDHVQRRLTVRIRLQSLCQKLTGREKALLPNFSALGDAVASSEGESP